MLLVDEASTSALHHPPSPSVPNQIDSEDFISILLDFHTASMIPLLRLGNDDGESDGDDDEESDGDEDANSGSTDNRGTEEYPGRTVTLEPAEGEVCLAILASYSGDELVTIYRYFRSLAVESPFVTAKDNLVIAFEKNRQNYSQLLGSSKPSSTRSVHV